MGCDGNRLFTWTKQIFRNSSKHIDQNVFQPATINNTRETISENANFTTALPCYHSVQIADTIRPVSNETTLSCKVTYFLFFYSYFHVLFWPYVFFDQFYLNRNSIGETFMRTFSVFPVSNATIETMHALYSLSRTKYRKPAIVFMITLTVFCDIVLVTTRIYEFGAIYFLAFPWWLAFVPGCYAAYHVVHHCISTLLRLIVWKFSSVSDSSVYVLLFVK